MAETPIKNDLCMCKAIEFHKLVVLKIQIRDFI